MYSWSPVNFSKKGIHQTCKRNFVLMIRVLSLDHCRLFCARTSLSPFTYDNQGLSTPNRRASLGGPLCLSLGWRGLGPTSTLDNYSWRLSYLLSHVLVLSLACPKGGKRTRLDEVPVCCSSRLVCSKWGTYFFLDVKLLDHPLDWLSRDGRVHTRPGQHGRLWRRQDVYPDSRHLRVPHPSVLTTRASPLRWHPLTLTVCQLRSRVSEVQGFVSGPLGRRLTSSKYSSPLFFELLWVLPTGRLGPVVTTETGEGRVWGHDKPLLTRPPPSPETVFSQTIDLSDEYLLVGNRYGQKVCNTISSWRMNTDFQSFTSFCKNLYFSRFNMMTLC